MITHCLICGTNCQDEPCNDGNPDSHEPVCEHGVALDVHCCNCHSGFIFDPNHECPEEE